jgi:tripartite-type tricarboxylate transporter receptor subunit TctC
MMKGRWIAAAVLMVAGMSGAQAQDYPTRTVTVIVPFAPGGPADITGRIVADIFSRHLGKQFVVENVGGAGGTIGSLRAARATSDGYTIISGHMGTHAAAPFFYPNLGYDPEKGANRADRRAAGAARGPQGLSCQQPPGVHRLRQS